MKRPKGFEISYIRDGIAKKMEEESSQRKTMVSSGEGSEKIRDI